jgi:hypothetical protein
VLQYGSFFYSIWTTYAMMLGYMESQGDFFSGNQLELPYLKALYFIASFILIIHLLNMLIALMGNQLSDNTVNQTLIRQQEKLKFVLDKWAYKNFIFSSEDDQKLKFIICVFIPDDESHEESMMKSIVEH